jgi:galactose-1-phosphate uridylyltransferase
MATFDEFIGSLEKEAGELVNYFNNHGPHCGMSDNHREPHIGLFIMDEWDNV